MRAFCTVSAPLEVCASSAEQLSPGSRFLALRLLGNQQPKTLYFLVDAKSRVREVYTQTCMYFATEGMLDTDLFGIAVLIDGEYLFADPQSKLSKYGPKSWRSSHTHGLDANGRPLLELHFRVQFYVESPFMLKDDCSKHNYYLQLRYNALQQDIPREYSEQSVILLAGLALQADLGDAPMPNSKNKKIKVTAPVVKPSTAKVHEQILLNAVNDKSKLKTIPTNTSATGAIAKDTAIEEATSTTNLKAGKRKSNTSNGRGSSMNSYAPSAAAAAEQASTSAAAVALAAADNAPSTSKSSLKRILNVARVTPKEISVAPSTSSCSSSSARSVPDLGPETDYFRVEEYLPEGLRSAWAISALRACHRQNAGMSAADAELHYIQQACLVNENINAHTYRMRLSKQEIGAGCSWIIVYAKGIKIIQTVPQQRTQKELLQQFVRNQAQAPTQTITFLWPSITKLSFERKKFDVRSRERKVTLYASSDEKNKLLLTLCKETHQFSMKLAARIKEVIKRDEEESNVLHACYHYSRSLHMLYKSKNDQRISVISSTSSNTTSGIVSDRVHSEDELEIMINTPPAPVAAPSTESLALAHLLDRPSVSRQTSSVGQVSLKDLEEQLAALSVRQAQQQLSINSGGESPTSNASPGNSYSSQSGGGSLPTSSSQHQTNSSTATDSPSSQHNIGSQCSSTCSTVVVAATTNTESALSSLAVHGTNSQRRNSTSSSLELGFSHTAQNSTLSEAESTCIDHDYLASAHDESESVSGVYTLAHSAPVTETSGVYTMNSSELTGQNSEMAESEKSSHYDLYQPKSTETSAKSVTGQRLKEEEFRLRCDSNVSTNGSFRGDGSDPQDSSHMLLSAKELTELIVGCGTYPTRKVVAATLDSDCDYVTLPMPLGVDENTVPTDDQVADMISDLLPVDPPAPPQRIDSNGLSHANYAQLNKQRMRSPPPYNARHEKTGLCGPPISHVPQVPLPEVTKSTAVTTATAPAILRRRDPPPYAKALKQRPSSLLSAATATAAKLLPVEHTALTTRHSLTSMPRQTEEVPARIITSRPQINILKAHTSLVNDNAKPSYAAPTISSNTQHFPSHLSQNSNYVSGSQASSTRNLAHRSQVPLVPYLPYNMHAPHKSMSSLHHQAPPPPPPYSDMKPPSAHTCVLLPVIKSQQYLPPPPPSMPRQPPPPPPNQLAAAVYGKQLELYQQQLYSDVDYVIYPIQDPAVSQQEYLDAKQGSILAALAAQSPPPPHPHAHSYLAAYHHHHAAWDTCKTHAIYRSTPYLPLALSHAHSRYASTQNLSDTYVQLPTACSPIYSPSLASLCSSFEPPPPPPLHPATLAAAANMHNSANYFARSRSDDNILNSLDSLPKMKRLPPPPPPPYVNRRLKKPPMPTPCEKPPPIPSKPATILRHQMPPRKPPTLSTTRSGHTHMTKTSSGAHWAGERPKPEHSYNSRGSNSLLAQLQASVAATAHTRHKQAEQMLNANTNAAAAAANSTANALDIALLREKSRNLDLPLISALCNDRSLLKQTKVLINSNNKTAAANTSMTTATTTTTATLVPTNTNTAMITTAINLDNNNVITTTATAVATTPTTPTASAKLLSSSKSRKISNMSHRHPNDKLPPLPMQLAEANNYVMDPAVVLKKNSNNSSSNNNISSNINNTTSSINNS